MSCQIPTLSYTSPRSELTFKLESLFSSKPFKMWLKQGVVTAVMDAAVTVHGYLPSPKFNAYQPTWELSNGKVEKTQEAAGRC